MKEQTKTTAAERGTSTNTETRRERWLKYARERLDQNDTCEAKDGFVPRSWIEEVYGKPAEEVVCDILARSRDLAGTAAPKSLERMSREDDVWYDTQSPRRRNNHDQDVARDAVYVLTNGSRHFFGASSPLTKDECHALYLRFARKEDVSHAQFETRAIRAALAAYLGKGSVEAVA